MPPRLRRLERVRDYVSRRRLGLHRVLAQHQPLRRPKAVRLAEARLARLVLLGFRARTAAGLPRAHPQGKDSTCPGKKTQSQIQVE